MSSSDPIYVIGHRNPDTDAICAAIGYTSFLHATGKTQAIAACCGEINARTSWVLRFAGAEAPKLLLDVRANAASICNREVITAKANDTFISVYRKMQQHGFTSIPVTDDQGRLLGMPTLLDLAQLLLPPQKTTGQENRFIHSSLQNIIHVLKGTFLSESTSPAPPLDLLQNLILVVAGSSAEMTLKRSLQFQTNQVVILVGDRPEIHQIAVEIGARALIITGGFQIDPALLKKAIQRDVQVISVPQDTASATQLIRFSRPISDALHDNYLSFSHRTPVSDILHTIQTAHQALFPVIDTESRRLYGVFSKSDLINPPRTKLILVDHNEFSQAVAGADEAEILEVIDHHRLSGNLRTREPIRFINEPVGSSSTIVAIMYRMRGLKPDRTTAICLCAGLISDTLNLTSPTATQTDHEILSWLTSIAGIDANRFISEFFAAGSMLNENTPERAIESDRKVFEENGWRISISQIEELGLQAFWKRQGELHYTLKALLKAHKLNFACLMVTDITENNSVLLVAGDDRIKTAIDYTKRQDDLYEMPGIVSRKKQLFPYLSNLVGQLPPP
jgi:manganese-dependent inorganic pyrophosphatase